jgi:hypothetical protein
MTGQELILDVFLMTAKALRSRRGKGFFIPQSRNFLLLSSRRKATAYVLSDGVSTIMVAPMIDPTGFGRVPVGPVGAVKGYSPAIPGIAGIILKYFTSMPVFIKLHWRKNPEPGTC